MIRKVRTDRYEITYKCEIKNVKNINLHIRKDGSITVSCNRYVPLEKVDAFVAAKCQWILDKINLIQANARLLDSDEYLIYKGRQYKIESVSARKNGVKLNEKSCLVYHRDGEDSQKIISVFLREECRKTFSKLMNEVYAMMSLDYSIQPPTLKIRSMSSRWGSCIPAKNQITLNSRLIHYDESFIRYVVIHEYAHLIQPNHSKAFYHVIEKYMPDYKQIMKNKVNLQPNER